MLNSCQALTRPQPWEQLFLSINGDSCVCNTQERHWKCLCLEIRKCQQKRAKCSWRPSKMHIPTKPWPSPCPEAWNDNVGAAGKAAAFAVNCRAPKGKALQLSSTGKNWATSKNHW